MIDPDDEPEEQDEPEPRFILDDEEQEEDAQLNDKSYTDHIDRITEKTNGQKE